MKNITFSNTFIHLFALLASIFIFISCAETVNKMPNSNEDSNEVKIMKKSQFPFTRISGLKYNTDDGITGVTQNGVYNFSNKSRKITFTLSELNISEIVDIDSIISINSLFKNDRKLGNFVKLLLSLDKDSLFSNGIQINSNIKLPADLNLNHDKEIFDNEIKNFLKVDSIVDDNIVSSYLQEMTKLFGVGNGYLSKWTVPLINQNSSDYNYSYREAACGPTSLAMILRFFYPNAAGIDMPEIYSSGIQGFTYNGLVDNYKAKYAGMVHSSVSNYLQNTWGVDISSKIRNIQEMKKKILQGPLLTYVYLSGCYRHFVVITQINEATVRFNDPWGGKEKVVSLKDFENNFLNNFKIDCSAPVAPYSILLSPKDTYYEREYSTVVDTANYYFDTDNKIIINNPENFIYNIDYDIGAWFYPNKEESIVIIPKIMKSGNYKITTNYIADNESSFVNYMIFSHNNEKLYELNVNQYSGLPVSVTTIIKESVYLENGAYIKAKIQANTNFDSIKLTYINDNIIKEKKCYGPANERECGNCGREIQVCKDGIWFWSEKCEEEGECSPAEKKSCGNNGEKICDEECSWNTCIEAEPECSGEDTYHSCYLNDIWSFDECDTPLSKIQNCTEQCVNGICEITNTDTCEGQCEIGDKRCSGDRVIECFAQDEGCNEMEIVEYCNGASCNNAECVISCTDQCSEGDTRCDGNSIVKKCKIQADGCTNWEINLSCQENEVCEEIGYIFAHCIEDPNPSCNADNYWEGSIISGEAFSDSTGYAQGMKVEIRRMDFSAILELRICSQGGVNFDGNSIYITIEDEDKNNFEVYSKSISTSSSSSCTSWKYIDNLASYEENDILKPKVRIVSPANSNDTWNSISCASDDNSLGKCWYIRANKFDDLTRTCK